MAAVRELFALFDVKFNNDELKKGNKEIDNTRKTLVDTQKIVSRVTSAFATLGLAIGAGAVYRGMQRFISTTIQIGDELDKTAQQLGLTTSQLQEWRHVAELGGVDGRAFSASLGQLQQRALAASQGSARAARAFNELGVEVVGADGNLKPVNDLLMEVADGLSTMDDSTKRVGLSMQLMGETGRRLLPAFQGGSQGIAQLRGELGELGGGASPEMIRQSVVLTDSMTRMRQAFLSVRSAIAVRILPTLERSVRWLTRMGAAMADVFDNSEIMKGGMIALGAAAVGAAAMTIGAWGPAFVTFVTVAGAVALMALAIDDLYVTAQGGDSVTRRFLEWAVGAEQAASMIRNVNQAIEDLRNTLATAAGYLGIDWGEEGTDRQRANMRGQRARQGTVEFLAGANIFGQGISREAPTLSEEDQAELARIRSGRETTRRIADEDFERRILPMLGEPRERPDRTVLPDLPAFGQTVMPQSSNQPRSISIDNPTTISISGVTNPEEVGRIVDRRLEESNERMIRNIQAAEVPEGAR